MLSSLKNMEDAASEILADVETLYQAGKWPMHVRFTHSLYQFGAASVSWRNIDRFCRYSAN